MSTLKSPASRTIDELRQENERLKAQNEELSKDLSEAEGKLDDMEETNLSVDNIKVAVDRFLDEINRPVGKLTFTVPTGERVDRAILGLFDAVGRNP